VNADIEWVAGPAAFAALEAEWDALATTPFERHCWFTAWWEAFGAGRELAICTARRDGELVGVLPLLRDGRRLASLTNAHTPSFRPLGDAAAVVAAAAAERPVVLEVGALPEDARPAFEARPGLRRWHAVHRSPWLDTTGEYEQWRSRTRPKEPERLRRKMDRDFEARFAIVERPVDLGAQLERGLELEAAGWKGRAGTAILSDHATADFYRRMAAAFDACDELRLTEIELDGELVASEICLLSGRRLYWLKNAYDESRRSLKPGRVRQLATIEWCFAQPDVDVLEMLGADEEFKLESADQVRPHHELRMFPRTLAGRARYAWRGARETASRLRAPR
jgi:CelD/BcsL family acetyltransferase involved in cellulose biosynthesis